MSPPLDFPNSMFSPKDSPKRFLGERDDKERTDLVRSLVRSLAKDAEQKPEAEGPSCRRA